MPGCIFQLPHSILKSQYHSIVKVSSAVEAFEAILNLSLGATTAHTFREKTYGNGLRCMQPHWWECWRTRLAKLNRSNRLILLTQLHKLALDTRGRFLPPSKS